MAEVQDLQKLEVSTFIENSIQSALHELKESVINIRPQLAKMKVGELRRAEYLSWLYSDLHGHMQRLLVMLKSCHTPLGEAAVTRSPAMVQGDLDFIMETHGIGSAIELDKVLRALKQESKSQTLRIHELERLLKVRGAPPTTRSTHAVLRPSSVLEDSSDDDERSPPSAAGAYEDTHTELSERTNEVLIVESDKAIEDSPSVDMKRELAHMQSMLSNLMTEMANFRTSSLTEQSMPIPVDQHMEIEDLDQDQNSRESPLSRRDYFDTLRELPDMEKFGGKAGQKLGLHITAFEERYPARYWVDSLRKQCFSRTLTGVAFDMFTSCDGTYTESLHTFKTLIEEDSGLSKNDAIDQYESLRVHGQKVAAFCKDLERLHRFIYPKDSVQNSRVLARRLMKQIDSWRGADLLHSWFASPDDTNIYKNVKQWALSKVQSRESKTDKSEKGAKEGSLTTPDKPTRSFDRKAAVPSAHKPTIVCYSCRKEGHKSNACPDKETHASVNNLRHTKSLLGKVPIATISLCDRREEALIDSGAQISVMPKWILNEWRAQGVDVEAYAQAVTCRSIKIRGIVPQAQVVSDWIALPVTLIRTGKTTVVQFAIMDTTVERIIIGHDVFPVLGITLAFDQPMEAKIQSRCLVQPHSHHTIAISGAPSQVSTLLSENVLVPDLQGVVDGLANICVYNYSDEPILLAKDQVVGVWESCAEQAQMPLRMVQTQIVDTERVSIDEQLGCAQMQEISAVLLKYSDIFTGNSEAPGLMKVPPAEIDTEDAPPRAQKVRPVPLSVQSELVQQLKDMERKGVTEKSSSPWASPLVLVRKKDGSLRICVDYRIVNKAIKKDRYPLPNAELMLQRLSGCTHFSTLDCLSGFHQVALSTDAKAKTAFVTPIGLYQFTRLPFGMANSPAIFQRSIDHILNTTGLWNSEIFCYMDDVVVGTISLSRHAVVLEILFQTFKSFGVALRADKSQIAKESIKFLGHIVSNKGIEQDPAKIAAIDKFPTPTNITELRSLLGMMTYYRKFIYNFALIAKPLYSLTSTKVLWRWEPTHQDAFQQLKAKLAAAPILKQPDIEAARSGEHPFIIYTDASMIGTGAVLAQSDENGTLHPVAFCSKALDKHQARYHITDLEALAVLRALERFHCFVYGVPVIIRTDHEPLLAVVRSSTPSNRLLRWILQFRKYDLKIEYIKGSTNVVADALSRGPVESDPTEPSDTAHVTEDAIIATIACSDWCGMLENDAFFGNIISELRTSASPNTIPTKASEQYVLVNDMLYRVERDGSLLLVVPAACRESIMTELHNNDWVGHFGPKKLIKAIRNEYYWPGLASDVLRWHKTCVECYIHNYKLSNTPPLQPVITSKPFEIVGMDLLDFNVSITGYRYCLTVVDYFSKWAELYPLKSKTAEEVLRVFAERWVGYGGRQPRKVISDNGTEFANSQFQSYLQTFCIEWCPAEPFNPRQNGLAERTQQTMIGLLRKSDSVLADWDIRIPLVVHAYNRSVHSSTGFSPFELLHGYQPPVLVAHDWTNTFDASSLVTYSSYVDTLKETLACMQGAALRNIRKATDLQKLQYDKAKHVSTSYVFKDNDIVMLKGRKESKIEIKFKGPYRILALRRTTAILQKVDKVKEIIKAPVDKLIPITEYNVETMDIMSVTLLMSPSSRCTDPRYHCSSDKCDTNGILKNACLGIVDVPPFLQHHKLPTPLILARIIEMIDANQSEYFMSAEISRPITSIHTTKEYLAVALGLHRERCIHAIRDSKNIHTTFAAYANLSPEDIKWSVDNALLAVQEKKVHYKHRSAELPIHKSFLILPSEYKVITATHHANIYVMREHETLRHVAHKLKKAATGVTSLIIMVPMKLPNDDYTTWMDRHQLITFIIDYKLVNVVVVLPPASGPAYPEIVQLLQIHCRNVSGYLLSEQIPCDLTILGPTTYEEVTLDDPQGCLGLAVAKEQRSFTKIEMETITAAVHKKLSSLSLTFDLHADPSTQHHHRPTHRDDAPLRRGMSGKETVFPRRRSGKIAKSGAKPRAHPAAKDRRKF